MSRDARWCGWALLGLSVWLTQGCESADAAGQADAGQSEPVLSADYWDTSARGYAQRWPAERCEAWVRPQVLEQLPHGDLLEASGLALGRRTGEVLWSHNDSGDTARLFAIDAHSGADLGVVRLTGGAAVDVEDIAAARCPQPLDDWCLWVADTGDNLGNREDAAIWVVPEPAAPGAGATAEAAVAVRVPVRYPGGPVDVEALVVAPAGGAAWLFEKGGDAEATRIFEVAGPFEDNVPVEAKVVGHFVAQGMPVPLGRLITGADLSPQGHQLLLRSYTGTWAYDLVEGQTPADLGQIEPVRAALGP